MATVLIIDDRHINREYLSSLLKFMKHDALIAHNGIEGLQMIAERIPDLIITDILMPQMDGYEFVKQLKANEKYHRIPIIFYTASYRKEEADEHAADLGVLHVLAKPADPQTIMNTIQDVLGLNFHVNIKSTPSQSTEELKVNLYRAPHELYDISRRLTYTYEQIDKIKNLMHLDSENAASSQVWGELINHIADDLKLYQKVNNTLFSLIELTFEMIEEKNAKKLLQLFCHGARKAVNAESAVSVILDNQGKMHIQVSSGKKSSDEPPMQTILDARSALIHENMLCTPILTTNKLYGFAYFVGKTEAQDFSNEDIRILDTLTSELAIFYENLDLYEQNKEKTNKLEIESIKLKCATEELRKSEVIFRQFAENIKDVFWRTSSNLDKVIYISPGYEEIWGKSTESIYQDPCSWQENVIEEDKVKVNTFIKMVIETQEAASIEYQIKRPDGEIRNIYNKTFCLKDQSGELSHLIGIASDVTEYLQNQKGIALEHDLSRILEKETPLSNVIPQILELICSLFDWEIGEFWLVNENKKTLQNIDIWYKNKEDLNAFHKVMHNMELKKNEDLPGKVWSNCKIMWVGDYEQHAAQSRVDMIEELKLSNALGLPLLYQEKAMGIMNFMSTRVSPPNENLIRILMTLGSRMGEYINEKLTHEQLLQLAKRGSNRIMF